MHISRHQLALLHKSSTLQNSISDHQQLFAALSALLRAHDLAAQLEQTNILLEDVGVKPGACQEREQSSGTRQLTN
ncbi:hypothetical protein [Comamonas kerstersii]|uniref:hypothetical protein n=1 Tax=Comamonas kerstersii TaxID=225992 RepID=UPI001063DD2C|nr:hypothetical protein [Comamonas kerstersii]